jgi:hypothetical protein
VFGTSRFSNYLAGKARINKTRSNRNFNLLRLSPEASPDELKHCQIVYLDAEYSKQAGRISSAIASEPVLFVSEATGKGIIDFVILERRVKFTIDSAKAQKAGIRVGTVLFDLAIGSNG